MAQPRRRGAEPLRLAADEATALLVAARAVATLPGLRESDRQALLRATAKLEAAAGEAAGASSRLSVTFESEGGVFADVDRAISERRRLWLRYYSPARDELTEREVDPIRLFAVGHTYMEAWCRLSEARRTFRLDRVAEIKLLDERVRSAADRAARSVRSLRGAGAARPPEDPEVVVEVGPGGRWVAEYYPHDSAEELPDGGLQNHVAHPRPRLAASAGAAARQRRQDRLARGSSRTARGQAARAGARGMTVGVKGCDDSDHRWVRNHACGRAGVFKAACPDCRGRFELSAGALRLAIGGQPPYHLLLLHLSRLRVARCASRPGSASSSCSPAAAYAPCDCTPPPASEPRDTPAGPR